MVPLAIIMMNVLMEAIIAIPMPPVLIMKGHSTVHVTKVLMEMVLQHVTVMLFLSMNVL